MMPSHELVTVNVNSGDVSSFKFGEEGVSRARLAVVEDSGEVYV